jgi:HSP20 family protein
MADFFEKLKRGMGIEIATEEEKEEKEKEIEEKKEIPISKEKGEKKNKKKVKEKIEMKKEEVKKEEVKEEKWPEPKGELAIDVYQTSDELVIQSAIAGVKLEDLNLSLEGDMLLIEGKRQKPTEEKGDYFLQECYWGEFARKIILPVEINPEKIDASFREGILTIRFKKLTKDKRKKILIKS